VTPYVEGDMANLVVRLRETRDAARARNAQAPRWLRAEPFGEDWTVAAQVEVLCSRLTEAADALERHLAKTGDAE